MSKNTKISVAGGHVFTRQEYFDRRVRRMTKSEYEKWGGTEEIAISMRGEFPVIEECRDKWGLYALARIPVARRLALRLVKDECVPNLHGAEKDEVIRYLEDPEDEGLVSTWSYRTGNIIEMEEDLLEDLKEIESLQNDAEIAQILRRMSENGWIGAVNPDVYSFLHDWRPSGSWFYMAGGFIRYTEGEKEDMRMLYPGHSDIQKIKGCALPGFEPLIFFSSRGECVQMVKKYGYWEESERGGINSILTAFDRFAAKILTCTSHESWQFKAIWPKFEWNDERSEIWRIAIDRAKGRDMT